LQRVAKHLYRRGNSYEFFRRIPPDARHLFDGVTAKSESFGDGSTSAMERDGFKRLMDGLEWGNVLIVTKLDRLGRNAMDVRATVEKLAADFVRVHCLALGGVDLTVRLGKNDYGSY
jgi:DNA invertase Pin-like site-specific DNA recombinase